MAARAFLDAGATRLESQLGAYVAAFGGCNWQTDNTIRDATAVRRRDGKQYHRESIARARRSLARRGLLESKRIFPGQLPHETAKRKSSCGTTAKAIRWKTLGLKNPTPRGQARKLRALQAREDPRPRHSSAAALNPKAPPAPIDAALMAVIESARAGWERNELAREQAHDARVYREIERGPPRR